VNHLTELLHNTKDRSHRAARYGDERLANSFTVTTTLNGRLLAIVKARIHELRNPLKRLSSYPQRMRRKRG